MKSILKLALVASAAISTGVMAEHHENCQVGENKVHVKTKKECTDQQGTWIGKATKSKKGDKKSAKDAKAPTHEAAPEATPEAAPAQQ
jgi:hypothetical protein